MVRTTTRHAVILICLLALTAAIYAPLREAPFVYEDVNWMSQAQSGDINVALRPTRALTYAIFHWTYLKVNFNPAAWHLTNVAIHLMNGVLVYALGAALLNPVAALGAAGLFLLHPMNSEAVSYVSALTDVLSTLFVLVAVLSVIGRDRWAWRGTVCVAALICAASSKEVAVVGVPLVLLTLCGMRRDSIPWFTPVTSVLWIACGVGAGAIWKSAQEYLVLTSRTSGSVLSAQEYAVVQAGLVWKFLVMTLWPVGLTVDHDVAQLGPTWLALSSLGIAVALVMAVICWRSAPMVTWSIGWVALALAPRFIIRTNEFLTEPQVYLAMIAIWLGIAGAATRGWALVSAAEREFWQGPPCQQEDMA